MEPIASADIRSVPAGSAACGPAFSFERLGRCRPATGCYTGKLMYTAMLLGATGNVGGHILHLLEQSPLCKKVIVVTRRHVAELDHPKVQQVVVNMDKLEEELVPHARGVDIALAAFGVGKCSAKMADEEVRKIEITYPTTFASAARA